MSLFIRKKFRSHSGLNLSWKVDCDAFTREDWDTIAYIISTRVDFSEVYGVPRGGFPLAVALQAYIKKNGPILIVDDVITTGGSMEHFKDNFLNQQGKEIRGFVVFDRSDGHRPEWIDTLWKLEVNYGQMRYAHEHR